MKRCLFLVAIVFVVVRVLTVLAYRNTLDYYGMIAGQFAIAEAAYNGHAFAKTGRWPPTPPSWLPVTDVSPRSRNGRALSDPTETPPIRRRTFRGSAT